MADDRPFLAIWQNDRSTTMSSTHLMQLSCDAESWANFMAMMLKRRKSATMRLFNPNRPAEREFIKVLFDNGGKPPAYASLA